MTVTETERRMRESAGLNRVSQAVQRFLLREFEDEGYPSPTLASHRMKDLGARLKGVVSLSAGGQIARLSPPIVLDAARKAIDDGIVHTASATGLKEYRQAVAAKLHRDNGIEADPDTEILATIGCQLPIFATLLTLIDPGDEVLIMEPEYASIAPVIRMVGATPVGVPYEEGPNQWRFDAHELERRVTPKSRLFIFSNGANPTGVLYTREELQAVARVAQDRGLMVFADEEYEYITFDGADHVSIASLPGMKERTISAYSFSKTFSMSGFRIGYMTAAAWVIDYVSDIIRFAIQSCPAISQKAAIPLLMNPRGPWLEETLRELQEKRDYAVDRLNRMPGIRCPTPRGCYFLLADIRALGLSSLEFAGRLLEEERVSVIPGITFGRLGEGHVRVSACVGWDGLREGLDRFERFVGRVAGPAATAPRSVAEA